jgi:IclR family acetate operon transcriptional repressor
MRGERDYTVDAVVRSFNILDGLAQAGREVGVLELSKRVKLHVSTVYRLLSTLKGRGFVDQNPETDKYSLGLKVFELGMARNQHLDIRAISLPYLRNFYQEFDETVFLGILQGTEVLVIESFLRYRGIMFRSEIGAGEPLYCTGIGKALLAHLEPKERASVLGKLRLKRKTANTLTRMVDLRDELARIRALGYSIDDQEVEEGVKCVGAPILDHGGYAVAAFSIAGPAPRIASRLKEITHRITEVSRQISRELGYVQPSLERAMR